MTKKASMEDLTWKEIVRKNELHLLDIFSNTSPGYGIPCRFCGWNSAYHDDPNNFQEDQQVAKKGFRISLMKCSQDVGYAPKNVREWEREDREDKRESEKEKERRTNYEMDRGRVRDG